MFCQGCQADVVPLVSIGFPRGDDPTGMAPQKSYKCPGCGNKLGRPEDAAVQSAQLQGVQSADEPADVAPVHAEPPRHAKKPQQPPADILGMARQRLDFVRARIEELRQYEAEEQMLSRMIDAAGPPVLRVVG